MTVKELIEALQKEDPATQIWQSQDEEGNGYAPTEGFSFQYIVPPEKPWGWTDDVYMEHDDRPIPEKAVACLVMWPNA